jgi:hypothetical protein
MEANHVLTSTTICCKSNDMRPTIAAMTSTATERDGDINDEDEPEYELEDDDEHDNVDIYSGRHEHPRRSDLPAQSI